MITEAQNLVLRNAVYDLIATNKTLGNFIVNSFALGKSLYPQTPRTSLTEDGQIWVLAMAQDEMPSHSRSSIHSIEIPVQIGIQAHTKPDDNTLMERFILLDSQIRDLLWHMAGYQCLRIEALRDPHGVPYNYATLREDAVFDCYFTAYFKKILQ